MFDIEKEFQTIEKWLQAVASIIKSQEETIRSLKRTVETQDELIKILKQKEGDNKKVIIEEAQAFLDRVNVRLAKRKE
jgi:hypothetical protein